MRLLRYHRPRLFCALLFPWLVGASVAIAQSGPTITLQPVPPKTVPPSNYPPGTTIVGQEIILGSVPARVWLEIRITGWAPEILGNVRVAISATDREQDGGGYSGANAECLGAPAIGAGNLWPAQQPCSVNADCRPIMSGITAPCQNGEPTRCVMYDGVTPDGYFPPGRFCEPGFQDRCDPGWIGRGVLHVSAVDPHFDLAFGIHIESGIPTDFHPSYLGTMVLDVPANAKGTYTIDFKEDETYMQNPNNPPNNNIPIGALYPAKITIACGRCCYGVGNKDTQCVDHVLANECDTYAASAVFQAGEVCPEGGGSACPVCALDEHCDDGLFCNGAEICDANGECRPGEPPCRANEKCKEKTNTCKRHGRKPRP